MPSWLILLGGLLVWAAHFFLLYAIASLLPGDPAARLLALAATVPALAADAGILWLTAARNLKHRRDRLDRWINDFGAIGALLSLIAVTWQALPAILV